jgi:hypothetical protein
MSSFFAFGAIGGLMGSSRCGSDLLDFHLDGSDRGLVVTSDERVRFPSSLPTTAFGSNVPIEFVCSLGKCLVEAFQGAIKVGVAEMKSQSLAGSSFTNSVLA